MISTRELLKDLASARRAGDLNSQRELKETLATREHIPNKLEAKEIRRRKAKAKT